MRESCGQHTGFPGAGAGEHKDRTIDGLDCVALLWVQAGEIVIGGRGRLGHGFLYIRRCESQQKENVVGDVVWRRMRAGIMTHLGVSGGQCGQQMDWDDATFGGPSGFSVL
jgi:hypothetical protein